MSDIIDEMSKYWDNESNCAQAVACGILDFFNMNEYSELIHDSLVGFGGGMGERSICGAVSGGLAALGIVMMNREIDKDTRAEVFKKFKTQFKTGFETLDCKDIIADFILPDNSIDRENPGKRLRCTNAVESAVLIAKEILDKL